MAHMHSACLAEFPLVTEALTAAAMAGMGDCLAQRQQEAKYSKIRTSHFTLKGLGEGVLWSYWYRFAEHWSTFLTLALLNWLGLGAANHNVLLRQTIYTVVSLALDLAIACPLIYSLWDIPLPALLSGTPTQQIPGQIRDKLGQMLKASMRLWTPVNIIIYNSPLRYRVILSSVADLFWQSIVSSIVSARDHSVENGAKEAMSTV